MTLRPASWLGRRAASCSWVALALLVSAAPVAANTRAPMIVGALPARGTLATARLVGPSGQLYTPNKDLTVWKRHGFGGVAATVVFAHSHRSRVYASGRSGPIYVLRDGVWNIQLLPSRGHASLSTSGPVVAAAQGRQLFLRAGKRWRRFGKIVGRPSAVWADRTSVYVANTHGRLRRGRTVGGKPVWTVLGAPIRRGDFVRQLAGQNRAHLYALTSGGDVLRVHAGGAQRVGRAAALRTLTIQALGVRPDNTLVVAGRLATGGLVVVEAKAGRLTTADPIPGTRGSDRVAVVVAGTDALAVATHTGRVFVRRPKIGWKSGTLAVAGSRKTRRFPKAAPARTR